MFTAEEVARMLLEKAHNTLKKHEEILKKSKNTAHEIDAGEEPNNDEAECPDSLKGEGSSSASKSESKKESSPAAESEDSEMEDEPLSDDDSDEEDESEESEDEEDKFEFKKSESGMHVVEYKTLKKEEKPLKKLMSAASNMPGSVASTGKPSIGAQIGFPGIKKEEDKDMIPNPDPKAPTHIKRQGEKEGKSRPLTDAQRKAGFGQSISSERKTSNIGQYEGIKAAREKKEKESKEPEGMDKSYEEKIKEGKGTEVFHSKKGKARTISGQERDSVTVKRGTANLKDQTDNNRRNREEKGQARKEHGETGKLHPTYLELGKDRRKKQGTIRNRQKDSIKFRKKNRGELEKERNAPRKRSTDE